MTPIRALQESVERIEREARAIRDGARVGGQTESVFNQEVLPAVLRLAMALQKAGEAHDAEGFPDSIKAPDTIVTTRSKGGV